MRFFVSAGFVVLLGGCQLPFAPATTAMDPLVANLPVASPQWRGLKFVRNRCADCHAVEPGTISTVPAAPTFQSVANRTEMSGANLNRWMRNHDNFPSAMYFEIPAEHIDDVVSYMLTLKGLRSQTDGARNPTKNLRN